MYPEIYKNRFMMLKKVKKTKRILFFLVLGYAAGSSCPGVCLEHYKKGGIKIDCCSCEYKYRSFRTDPCKQCLQHRGYRMYKKRGGD